MTRVIFPDLLGKTFTSVQKEMSSHGQDELIFTRQDGKKFKFTHHNDCCESVMIKDICGDLHDLEGAPLSLAEEAASSNNCLGGSCTWTFYRFETAKGAVTVTWYGESNGYYSEHVDFEEVK